MTLLADSVATSVLPGKARGRSTFEQTDLADWGGPRIRAYFHRPDGWTENWPVIMVLHGANRNVDYTANTWLPLAQSFGFMPVIPHFTEHSFRSEKFAVGGIRRGAMKPKSAFNAIEPLFDHIRAATGAKSSNYSLFGHSAGAQFVERFLLLNPQARAERTVISMAGWYTLPDRRLPWPYGLANVPADEESFASVLEREGVLLLGGKDNDPAAERLRRTSLARRQGAHRLERGLNFFEQLTDLADRHDIPMAWQLRVLPGTAHNSRAAAVASANWLASGEQRYSG